MDRTVALERLFILQRSGELSLLDLSGLVAEVNRPIKSPEKFKLKDGSILDRLKRKLGES
jgi:hypothetical protein